MKTHWDKVTENDVKEAIKLFESKHEDYPEPRNTFLIYKEKSYPAKHIRGLAYFIANKKEISKSEYSGGAETVNFFKKLGFMTSYKNERLKPTSSTKELVPAATEKTSIKQHKIARLIVTGKQYDKSHNANFSKLEKLIEKFLATEYNKRNYEFILTPGGFLTFNFPDNLQDDLALSEAEIQHLAPIKKAAGDMINSFFESLNSQTFQRLKETADFFTIGIDGASLPNPQHIELVAIYDLKKMTVIHWTGKFYPTEGQKKDLIKINDLESHFMELKNQKIMVLGCHDLNVFSPRGQANANPDGWKKLTADKFKTHCRKFKPDIILQHPHTTDTPNIWNVAWRTLEKELPNVKHFASGIKYYRGNGVRGEINTVLEKTKKGDVTDFYFG